MSMSSGPWRPDDTGRGDPRVARRRRGERRARPEPRALETEDDRRRLLVRARLLEAAAAGLVALLLLGFWQLQIVRGTYYADKANANLLREARIRPARGLILDRNGTVLATNRPTYEVGIVREAVRDRAVLLAWLAEVLEMPTDTLARRLERQRGLPRFRPAIVASAVSKQRVVAIEARRREFPGVVVQVTPQRHYPLGTLAAHVLGYVGEISAEQLRRRGGRFRMGDIVGKEGIEARYDAELVGQPGSRLSVVDSTGREVELLEQTPPVPGQTVVLTIDARLQRQVEEELHGHRGAVVAIDVRSGDVLALASYPAFDPNAFAARFSADEWQALVTDPNLPLQDRALRATQPPGSIFKLVMATAALEEHVIATGTHIFCPGGKEFYGHFYRCLGVHGSIDVVEAITRSCNSFFYEVGVKLGRARIVEWAERFGLGAPTGVDLPNEDRGIVPSDEWLARVGRRYYPGETVSLAIGQGPLGVSPLQLARIAATLATGVVRQPHLLLRVEEPSTGRTALTPVTPAVPARFSERTRRTVLRGMRDSVLRGSSRRARLATLEIGGKTGTAQVVSAARVAEDNEDRPERLRNHAWFLAIAPLKDPRIALAVFLEHGGSGGGAAAPLGGRILARYFGLPVDQVGVQELTADGPTTGTARAAAVATEADAPARERIP